jgi:hypothetical protein
MLMWGTRSFEIQKKCSSLQYEVQQLFMERRETLYRPAYLFPEQFLVVVGGFGDDDSGAGGVFCQLTNNIKGLEVAKLRGSEDVIIMNFSYWQGSHMSVNMFKMLSILLPQNRSILRSFLQAF